MKKLRNCFVIVVVAIGFTSCSNRLVGTWNVDKYEVTESGKKGFSMTNIGSLTFNKNGSALKDFYVDHITTQKREEIPFKWDSPNDSKIVLNGVEADFAKTWIIIENKRKSQTWKSTDGGVKVQTIKLTKK